MKKDIINNQLDADADADAVDLRAKKLSIMSK